MEFLIRKKRNDLSRVDSGTQVSIGATSIGISSKYLREDLGCKGDVYGTLGYDSHSNFCMFITDRKDLGFFKVGTCRSQRFFYIILKGDDAELLSELRGQYAIKYASKEQDFHKIYLTKII